MAKALAIAAIIIFFIVIMTMMDTSYQAQVKTEVESRGFELGNIELRVFITPFFLTKNTHVYKFTYKEKDTWKVGWVRFGIGTDWKWDYHGNE